MTVTHAVRTLVKTTLFDCVPGLLRRGARASKRVALTFDDGPDDYTLRYLDKLDELAVPATFFLIGKSAATRPALVREYLRRGHQIGGHGYDHTRFTKLDRRALLDQCARTDEALGGVTTGRSWVRPPHGTVNTPSLVTLRLAGYKVALWSLDSCDYGDHDPAVVAERCSPPHVTSGEVLLFHEGQQWTLDALPAIVGNLRNAGYECVTMFDLMS